MPRVLHACALCLAVVLAALMQSCAWYGEPLRDVRGLSSNSELEQTQRSMQQQQEAQGTQPKITTQEPESSTAEPTGAPEAPLASPAAGASAPAASTAYGAAVAALIGSWSRGAVTGAFVGEPAKPRAEGEGLTAHAQEQLQRKLLETRVALEQQQRQELQLSQRPMDVQDPLAATEEKGNSAVSAPSTAEEGMPFRALLRVSKGEMSELMAGLKADVPGNRPDPVGAVSLSPVMTASISGVDFEISPSEPQTQAINLDGDTTWEWDVKAKRSGTLTLVFRLSTVIVKDGQVAPRTVKSYRKSVDVKVSPASVVEQHSGTIASTLATIVAALLAVWLTVWLQRRHEAKSKAAPTPTITSQAATTPQPIAQLPSGKPPPSSKRRPGARSR
jgi:hypothetical protein